MNGIAAALRKVEEAVLQDHIGHCVENAISSGNTTEQRAKVAELVEVLSRSNR
ncbi:MAG: metal-sensing transcriptional repressor [Hyphomicrobium sp.]|nr:metal-sensing transcriptional repressor [Hyphomicrobiales bacterium]